jgi:small subunit ribosomal protein S16
VGAQPSDRVKVLIKKYGSAGTHLEEQRLAIARLTESRRRRPPPAPQGKGPAPEPAEDAVVEETAQGGGETADAEPTP